jgi:hypothetical protein
MSKSPAITPAAQKPLESVTLRRADLQQFMDLANELPPDFELPEWNFGKPGFDAHAAFQADNDRWQRLEERQRRMKHKGQPKYAGVSDHTLLVSNISAQEVRATLRAIASAGGTGGNTGPIRINLPFSNPDRIEIGPEGTIAVMRDEEYQRFVQALDGRDATRIRECPLCCKIYWAARKHQQVCSPTCRVRKWRTTHPDEWEDSKAEYEVARAKREASRARKEGTLPKPEGSK